MRCNHVCRECGKHETGNWIEKKSAKLKENGLCFTCDHWNDLFLIRDRDDVVRVDGGHHMIGPENTGERFRGHGGHRFKIRFFDGRETESSNLWFQGGIPARWKERLPDNAEFLIDNIPALPESLEF